MKSFIKPHIDREYEFQHSFQIYPNPIYICGYESETPTHHLLFLPAAQTIINLLEKISNFNSSILEQNDKIITKDLQYGSISLDDTSNTQKQLSGGVL